MEMKDENGKELLTIWIEPSKCSYFQILVNFYR